VNRQSGVGDSKYVVFRDPLLTDDAIRRMRSANFTVKWPMQIGYFCHLLVIRSTYDRQKISW